MITRRCASGPTVGVRHAPNHNDKTDQAPAIGPYCGMSSETQRSGSVHLYANRCRHVDWCRYAYRSMHSRSWLIVSRLCFAAVLVMLQAAAIGQSTPISQSDFEAQAVQLSPELQAARQQVAEASAKVAEMNGHRRFDLTLSGHLSGSSGRIAQPAANQNFWSAEADLAASIPNMPRVSAEIVQASAALRAAKAQLLNAKLAVVFKARQVFLEYWRAADSLDIANANCEQATRQLDDTRKRIDAGDVPPSDLLKVQVQAAQAQVGLQRAQIASASASAAVDSILLKSDDVPVSLAKPNSPNTAPLNANDILATALANSPDIASAAADVQAAEAALTLARHSRDPDFSLQLSHVRTTDPTAYSNLTALSLNITLPLTDGGVGSAQIRQAKAALARSKSSLDLKRRQVTLDVTQTVLEVQGDIANLAASEQIVKIAQESLAKARQAYKVGLTTTREVLDAQLIYSQARVESNSARYDLAIARAHLEQLAGGSLP